MRKLRIGLDLDGVAHDYVAGVRRYLSVALNRPVESFPDPQEYAFRQSWCPELTTEEFVEHMNAGVDAGVIFRWGKPPAGAAVAVQRLLAVGHEVHIVTARSAGAPGAAETSTREWLAEHHFRYTSLTLTSDKTSVPTDVFVEDYLGNVEALEAAGTTCWVVDRPWNQLPPGVSDPPGRHRASTVVEAALQIADYALSADELAHVHEFRARMANLTRAADAAEGAVRV